MTDLAQAPQENAPDPATVGKTTNVQAVPLLHAEVVNADVSGLAKPLADQAAAMMIQDMQSFLQSNQQVMTIAIAKAAAMVLNESTAATGNNALQHYAGFLVQLADYSMKIGSAASGIVSDFKG